MPSSATLSTLRDRVENLLLDTSNTVWATGILDEAISLALEEYSRARPLVAVGTVTPTADTREVSVSSLTGLVNVIRVWWPYTSSNPEYPPSWVTWSVFWNGGTPTLFIDGVVPDGTLVARVFYEKLHTLNGLAGAGATTYPATDDGILVLGAAGYACLTRGTDVLELNNQIPFGTRNYAQLAGEFLAVFRRELKASRGTDI